MLIFFTKHWHTNVAYVFWWKISLLCHAHTVVHDDETSLQFLHEIRYCLFKFQSVIFTNYLWRQFELRPYGLWQKISPRS